MYFPAVHDERTTLVNYLEQQLNAVRDASHGLTEEQARSRPLPSELSLAGLLKHVAWCMSGALAGARTRPGPRPGRLLRHVRPRRGRVPRAHA